MSLEALQRTWCRCPGFCAGTTHDTHSNQSQIILLVNPRPSNLLLSTAAFTQSSTTINQMLSEMMLSRHSPPTKHFCGLLQGLFQGLMLRTKNSKKIYNDQSIVVLCLQSSLKTTSNALQKLYGLSTDDKKRQCFHSSSRCWLFGDFPCVLVRSRKNINRIQPLE